MRIAIIIILCTAGGTALKCPKNLTLDSVKDACLTTTRRSCSDRCQEKMKLANTVDTCFPDLLEEGKKYGFGLDLACSWRPACEIDVMNGLACPQPKRSPNKQSETTFTLGGLPGNFWDDSSKGTRSKWTKAYAEVLGVRWGDVRLFKPKFRGSRLLSDDSEASVVVYTTNVTEAEGIENRLAAADFGDTLQDVLISSGVPGDALPLSLVPVGIESSGPKMFQVATYKPSEHVQQLHEYSPQGEAAWSIDPNTEAGKAYLTNIGILFATTIVMYIFGVLEYFVFACATSCKCCKKCCCCNNKRAWGGTKIAKSVMVAMFLGTLAMMMCTYYGRNHLQDGLKKTARVMGNVSKLFFDMEDAGKTLCEGSNTFANVTSKASCKQKATNEALDLTAGVFKTASGQANDLLEGMGQNILNTKEKLAEDGARGIDFFFIAVVALFAVVAFFGVLSTLIGKQVGRICLMCNNGTATITLIMVMLNVGFALVLSVLLADFCHGDPLANILTIAQQNLEGDALNLMEYYLKCGLEESNPLILPLADAEDMTEALRLQAIGLANTKQCPDQEMQRIYDPQTGVGAKVGGALSVMRNTISCETINPLLVDLSHHAICDSMVSGLYYLWSVQVVASVFLWVTMHYTLFVRLYLYDKDKKLTNVAPEAPSS